MAWPFRRKSEEEHRSSTLAYPSADLIEALGGSSSWSGERVTEKSALGLAAVFSAVEKISESVGSLPLKVFRVMDDDERVPATTHRTWRMLHDQPNPITTAHAFWSTVTASLLLRGNAYLYKERDEFDIVDQLWILDPSTITVEWDGRTKRFVQDYDGKRKVWGVDEVLHVMGFSLNGITGCSRIEYCRQSLGSAIARARFEAEFYNQGARIPGVIEYPGRLGEQGTKNLAQSFKDKHTGSGNRHKVPVLEEGAHFQAIGMSMEDMQFVEGAQLSRSDVANLFQLPASYLNASTGDSLRYETVEANAIQYATQAVAPLTNRIQKALSSDPSILPWNVMYAEFVLEALFRADMKSRVAYWKELKAMGVVENDYIAARENLPKPPKEKPVPQALPQPNPNQLQLVKETSG